MLGEEKKEDDGDCALDVCLIDDDTIPKEEWTTMAGALGLSRWRYLW